MTSIPSEPLMEGMSWQTVPSLVGALKSECLVARPADEAACREALRFCRRHRYSVSPRGGGFSYGDAILNDRNVILDTSGMNRILDFDPDRGLVTVEPGVRLIDIYRIALPHRFVLTATPSESMITVAGAMSANVNGKDGWREGNFGDQVVSLRLMLASGEIVSANRDEHAELFHAVIGGMGLLGVIVEATLQLKRVPSPFLETRRTPVANLTHLLEFLQRVRKESDCAVAWLDPCATGSQVGRAVVHATRWIDSNHDNDALQSEVAASLMRLEARLSQAKRLRHLMQFVIAAMMQVQRISVRLFNQVYYSYSVLRQRFDAADNIESILRYNFDASFMIPSAAAVCGRYGYTVQLTIPASKAHAAISELIDLCQHSPCLPAKLIMRLHRRDGFLLSFSEDGYSLNFELHPKRRHVSEMRPVLNDLIATVIRYGGRVHLAKDHVLTRQQFRTVFPGYRSFLAIKHRFDPEELFQSDLYRRLIRESPAAADGASDAARSDAAVSAAQSS